MIFRTVVAQAVLAGASVAAITVAPTTHAAPSRRLYLTGSASVPVPGNAQISATPPAVDYQRAVPVLRCPTALTAARLLRLQRDGDHQRRPAPRRAVDLQSAGDRLDSVLETDQS